MATAIAIGDSERLRRRERRRLELLDAADRVIRRGGIAFSMDEIASEAGITKPVLYRHFGDKEGLHEALTERYIGELKQALRPATRTDEPRARLAATIDAYLAYVERGAGPVPLPARRGRGAADRDPGRRVPARAHRRVRVHVGARSSSAPASTPVSPSRGRSACPG